MVKFDLRIKTFIPQDEVFFFADQYYSYYFVGDNRDESFSSSSYRTYQRFYIDTSNYSITPYKNTGTTYMRMYRNSNGELISTDSDKASTSGLTYTTEVKNGYLYIYASCDVGNPMVPSPNINYEFTIRISRDGSIKVTGKHDGFPAYEIWRKIDTKSSELIYLHDPRDTGETIFSLGPPMEHSVDASKSA